MIESMATTKRTFDAQVSKFDENAALGVTAEHLINLVSFSRKILFVLVFENSPFLFLYEKQYSF